MDAGEGQGPQRCGAGFPRQEQLDCWLLQGPRHRCLPLLPAGPRKGEEVEEKWAPADRVSE